MIKSIKKLFSVDESELDFEEIEETSEKSNLYQEELAQNNVESTSNLDFSIKNTIEDQGHRFREIDANIGYEQPPIGNEKIEAIKEYKQQTDPFISDELENINEKTARRSFDFEKAIETSYEVEQPEVIKDTVEEVKEVETKKTNKEIVNKDNYVLKDIISPMRGVVRKEKNTIKKDEGHKKAQIIKLREQVTTKEIDQDDEYSQTIEFPFDTSDTKDLESTLTGLTKESVKDTLSETSRFTLIEDSTGEMRLVIDDEE